MKLILVLVVAWFVMDVSSWVGVILNNTLLKEILAELQSRRIEPPTEPNPAPKGAL